MTDGIASAMAQAKVAVGDRDVVVHGACTAERALEAGLLDEVQIHQIPVLFGRGRRLFDVLPSRTGAARETELFVSVPGGFDQATRLR